MARKTTKRPGRADDAPRPMPDSMKSKQRKSSANTSSGLTTFLTKALSVIVITAIAYSIPNIVSWWNGPKLDWWQKTIIYQIYPRSFQDSDGDGVGDLQGIISRLDYIRDLGVRTIWLSPFYKSPMADFGYDVSDYTDVDPIFGTIEDFDQLVKKAHEKDLKVVIDFIPNHTSDKHRWFLESRKGGAKNPHRDYYVWRDGKILEDGRRAPPNNWLSIFGGSAWEWDEGRQQYYLHQFVKGQPDLNYRNPRVREDVRKALKFWLAKDVDGFRIDAILTMFEDPSMRDEPRSFKKGVPPNEYGYLKHPYTKNQDEIHEVMREWRDLFDEYEKESGKRIYFVTELYDKTMHHAMKYYHSGADAPFNFNLVYINKTCGGNCIHKLVSGWLDLMPKGKWAHWVIGNHDQKRMTTKKGPEYANVMNMLNLLLPGTPTTYYGEEIGQLEIDVAYEKTQDPWGINAGKDRYHLVSRDPCRAPMQWNDKKNGGFSTADTTWLPVHPGYQTLNVAAQEEDEQSSLNIYRLLANLRQLPSFQYGDIQYNVVNQDIFSFFRFARNQYTYLVILNVGSMPSTDNYEQRVYNSIKKEGKIVLNSGNMKNDNFAIGRKIKLKYITLKPGEGLVLRIVA